jgi:hypothetical protein
LGVFNSIPGKHQIHHGAAISTVEENGALMIKIVSPRVQQFAREICISVAIAGPGLFAFHYLPRLPMTFPCCAAVELVAFYLLVRTAQEVRRKRMLIVGHDSIKMTWSTILSKGELLRQRSSLHNCWSSRRALHFTNNDGSHFMWFLRLGREDLEWLAQTLRHWIKLPGGTTSRPSIPRESKIVWNKNAEGSSIIFPRNRKLRAGAAMMTVVWLGLVAIILLDSEQPAKDKIAVIIIFAGMLFPLIFAFFYMSRRQPKFRICQSVFSAEIPSRWGRQSWKSDQIIDVSFSHDSLIIWPTEGKFPVRLLIGGTPAERSWLVQTLRHELSPAVA